MKPVPARRRVLAALGFAGVAVLMPATAGADGVRDPMRPPVAPAAQAARAVAAPVLQAVFHAAGRRVAVVNGRTVREGDTVAGLFVESIGTDSLRYRQGNRRGELRLGPSTSSIKQAAGTPAVAPGAPVP